MATNLVLDEASAQQRRVWLEFLFADDVFAPAKALELFAAINQLPEEFRLRRTETGGAWVVLLAANACPRIERVVAKIRVMPGLKSAREIAPPDDFNRPEWPMFA